MAKQTGKAVGKESTEVATQEERKVVASSMSAGELAALASKTKAADAQARNSNGIPVTFISLAKDGTKALKESSDLYIEDLQMKEFFVQNTKTILGKKLKIVPLYFLSVYTEHSSADFSTAKFLGVWREKDGDKFPLLMGSFYDRELPNGNVLRPGMWLMCYVVGHPEIENPVITFKSTGFKIVKELKKTIEANGGLSCGLEFQVSAKLYKQEKGDKEWYDFGFELIDKTLEIKGNEVKLYKPYAELCLKTANELAEADKNALLVAPRVGAASSKAAESGADNDDDDDDDTDYDDEGGAEF